jgi:TRAP-type C4-dicarboxylate transport system substrate-binding protein
MMDKKYFNNLPADIQKIILDAGQQAAAYVSKINTDGESESFKKWQAKGVEVITLTPHVMASFEKATSNVVKDNFPNLQSWVDKIKAVK